MSKRGGPYPRKYTIVKVFHFDGRVEFELRENGQMLRVFPETALQFAVDALAKIEEYQGLTKEAEIYSLDLKQGAKVETSEES